MLRLPRRGLFARLALIAAFTIVTTLAVSAAHGVPIQVFAQEDFEVDGLVVQVEDNVLHLVLNYGPLQPVDISRLSGEDRARLVVGQWAEILATRDGDRIIAVSLGYTGECLNNADRQCKDPGAIGGTANAEEIVARALATPLPPLPEAGANVEAYTTDNDNGGNDNEDNGNGNDNGNDNGDNGNDNGNSNDNEDNGNGNDNS